MFSFPPESVRILRWKDFLEKEIIILKSLGFQERKQNSKKVEQLIPKHREITCLPLAREAEGRQVVGPRIRDGGEGWRPSTELTRGEFSLPRCWAGWGRGEGQNPPSHESLRAWALIMHGVAVPISCQHEGAVSHAPTAQGCNACHSCCTCSCGSGKIRLI